MRLASPCLRRSRLRRHSQPGNRARVIDAYSVKPFDALRAAEVTGGRIVTVEDHWAEGGVGEAILSALGDQATLVSSFAVSTCRAPESPRSYSPPPKSTPATS